MGVWRWLLGHILGAGIRWTVVIAIEAVCAAWGFAPVSWLTKVWASPPEWMLNPYTRLTVVVFGVAVLFLFLIWESRRKKKPSGEAKQGAAGRGGNASVKGSGKAVGGPGGGGGLSPGGDGGDATVIGDGEAYGGEGGEGAQRDRPARGGRSGAELKGLNLPGNPGRGGAGAFGNIPAQPGNQGMIIITYTPKDPNDDDKKK